MAKQKANVNPLNGGLTGITSTQSGPRLAERAVLQTATVILKGMPATDRLCSANITPLLGAQGCVIYLFSDRLPTTNVPVNMIHDAVPKVPADNVA